MSKAIGLALILAGAGIGAFMLTSDIDLGLGSTSKPEAKLQAPQGVAVGPPASRPSAAVVGESRHAEARAPRPAAEPQPAAVKLTPPPAAADAAPARTAPVVVTSAQRASEPAARAQAMHVQAAPPPDRAVLARELQKELRRVGCYAGDINGAWTPQTRRAMKSFTDRVNATLPIEQPDYILLAMVQNHADKACGKPCPAGQALAEEGRCLPNAIIARRDVPTAAVAAAPSAERASPPRERPARVVSGWATTATAAAPSLPALPLNGRMALAGPAGDSAGRPAPVEPAARLAAALPDAVPAGPAVAAEQPPGARPPRQAARRPARGWNASRGGWNGRYATAPRRQGFGPSFFKTSDRYGL